MSAPLATTVKTTSRAAHTRFAALAALLGCALCVFAAPASANAPNPTSIVVNSVKVSGSTEIVTVSGTWTWDERVPNGPQKDCNDSRIGVGYAVIWGDNTANPLKVQGTNELVYVGDTNDDWVHSVTQGTQTVDGPFKKSPATLSESMLGETPDAVLNGFGPQGVSTGATAAIPTKADAESWVSNCGPTTQSVVDGQTIGNSKPSEPTNGFPNGTWGPISHTYTTKGSHKICPVFYDPHGNEVGGATPNQKEITAGGTNHNGDNSIESNGNKSACVVSVEPGEPAFEVKKEQEIAGSGTGFTTAKLQGKLGQTVDYRVSVKDTGNTTLTLGALSDPKCDAGTISSPSQSPISPGQSAFYTCSHVLNAVGIYTNVATVTGTPPGEPPISHETPLVEVEVPAAPAFEVKKEQEIAGSGMGFTTAKLQGKLGQTVDYRVSVKDTGNTTLTLGALSDPKCDAGTISSPSQSPISPGQSAFYTCSHVLNAVGIYTNVATVTGTPPGEPPISHETPPVEVEVPEALNFEITKEQRFEGQGSYTTGRLIGNVGQRVEYRITVKDTGNTSLALKALVDPKCDAGTISGPSQSPIAPGEAAIFTCSHVLNAVGVYTNVATDTAANAGKELTKTSNEVEVEAIPVPRPAFETKKEQRLAGETTYTTAKLTGRLGQTVEYRIDVTDTGNTTLTLAALSDPKCDAGTISAPSQSPIAPGQSAFYTCTHVLAAMGSYVNVAVVTTTPPGEPPISHETPPVEVSVPAPPAQGVSPSLQAAPSLKGPQGCVRGSFTASVKATGVASVTFYLDGHKLKTLSARNAHKGLLTITVTSSKLTMGGHHLTAKITMTPSAGSATHAPFTRALTFVRCGSPVVTPHFTG